MNTTDKILIVLGLIAVSTYVYHVFFHPYSQTYSIYLPDGTNMTGHCRDFKEAYRDLRTPYIKQINYTTTINKLNMSKELWIPSTITTTSSTTTLCPACVCEVCTPTVCPVCECNLTEKTADKLMNLRIEGKAGISAFSGGFMKCKQQVLNILGLKYIPGSTGDVAVKVPPVWYGVPSGSDEEICFRDDCPGSAQCIILNRTAHMWAWNDEQCKSSMLKIYKP